MPKRPVVVLVCCFLLCSTSLPAGERVAAESHVGKDPLIVIVGRVESLMSPIDAVLDLRTKIAGEVTPETIEAAFVRIDEELGFPVREDLLRQVGPEFGVVVDLDHFDTVFEKAGGLPGNASEVLGRVGVLAQVRDAEKVDLSLRKLALSVDERVTIEHDEENLATVRIPINVPMSGAQAQLQVVYGIRDGWLAIGFDKDWVRTTLAGPAAGARLADGADYTRVMSQLDANPDLLAYVNLPALLKRVQASNMLKMMLDADAAAQKMFDVFANEETLNVGWGHTSIHIDGSSRATTFGPKALSVPTMYAGIIGAITIPNLLNAVDRGKQKRTMADVRSIGTAIEAYSIDNNRYPVTDGWQTVDAIAEALEPVYIRSLPREDGWGHPILVFADGESYTLVSPGKDGEVDQEWIGEVKTGPTPRYANDVVFADGQFMRWPEGTQQ